MYIGVDLGGTNIAAGVVDSKANILAKGSLPTGAKRSPDEIISDMERLCTEIIGEAGLSVYDIDGIGIGIPGTVDPERGIALYTCNIPNLSGVSIGKILEERLGKKVRLENDANAAALGEYIVNGNGADPFVCITLGTGIGGGIIINGKIFSGFNGAGGEPGHMTIVNGGIKCACGKRGCWEKYASVTALIEQTKAQMAKHPESLMHKLVKERGYVSGRTATEAAKLGDAAAIEVVDKYFEYIADGIVSIVNIFQPELVVIGGGISREGDYLLKPVREYVEKYDYNRYLTKTQIKTAKLFNDAGIIGAAFAARE